MQDRNLHDFIKHLTQDRDELSGLPICPFLAEYITKVRYAHVDNIQAIIENNSYIIEEMQADEGACFIYIIDCDISYENILNLCKSEQEKYDHKDIEMLFLLKNDKSIPPLKVLENYSYKHNTLFILQRKTTLQKARNILARNTNYYSYWSRKK